MNIYVVIPIMLSLMLIIGSRGERYSFCPHGTESSDVEPTVLCFTHSAPAALVSIFWCTVGMVLPQGLCIFFSLCLGYSSTGCLWACCLPSFSFLLKCR